MHAAGYAALGLDGWRYEAVEVAPEALAEFVGALAGADFRGVNVTIPHKEAVIALCDELSDEAAAAGSVNTLLVEPHGIRGESTDGRGLLWALGDVAPGRAVVLGAGVRRGRRRWRWPPPDGTCRLPRADPKQRRASGWG